MSFSDMMSSGRGPGVIGMVMALIVLLGFGVLFMFAFDEGMQGGDQTIESVIRQQDKEIESYRSRAEAGDKELATAPGLLAGAKELSRVKLENSASQESIARLSQEVEDGKGAVESQKSEFEAYKDQYRALVRGQAKGQGMDELKTVTGTIYKNVNIREVTAVGIQIRHEEGQKRIPFEELPLEMQDHFQFDPDQKEKAIAMENADRHEHETAVAAATDLADQQMAVQRAKDREENRQKVTREIAAKESQIAGLISEIKKLEADVERANSVAAAARGSGRMHINKAGSIKGKIRSTQNRLAAARSELSTLKSRL